MVLCNREQIMKTFTAVIEKCPDTQLFVGYVPGFPGAHTQAASLDELHKNLQEVLQLLLEEGDPQLEGEFIGTQTIMVS
jgi:predicted RNase H-like HicB family nuclease